MLSASVFGQRLAYVDSEYILRHIPEYSSAHKQLDALSEQWQKEIETKFAEAVKMSKDYQADKVLLTDEQDLNSLDSQVLYSFNNKKVDFFPIKKTKDLE